MIDFDEMAGRCIHEAIDLDMEDTPFIFLRTPTGKEFEVEICRKCRWLFAVRKEEDA